MKGDIISNTVAVENARLVSDSLRLLENLGSLPEPAAEPFFIAVCGLPGTGKSYFCRQLAEKLTAVLVESDALRKVLFFSPCYSAEESHHLFCSIHLLIEKLLIKGIPVILDATNLSEKNREHLYNISERLNVRFILVRTSAPQELVRQRLQARQTDPTSKSDANWDIYLKMQYEEEEIHRKHYTLDTSQDISSTINKIIHEALR